MDYAKQAFENAVMQYEERKGMKPMFINAVEEEVTDSSWVARTFKSLIDLFDIYGQETILLFEEFLLLHEYSFDRIQELKKYGAESSTWSSKKGIEEKCKRIGKQAFQTVWIG